MLIALRVLVELVLTLDIIDSHEDRNPVVSSGIHITNGPFDPG